MDVLVNFHMSAIGSQSLLNDIHASALRVECM